ncbi:histidine kinase [Roseateles asaccharophilus]|uniref:Signal transduction histidine kinase n=1 Tax=Roseateles asaccharophilus TaxID=582607 RepID=A0ABU2ADF1_9BURK|nr:histidine kinase [Roseateles asaccharophilus]MDR7335241.1 signal transduction histidine kinase [Roseateles asaccharophilus]
MSSSPSSKTTRLDWEQWYYPGPRRVFTADEMARAGTQPWPSGIDHYTYVNVIMVLAVTSHETSRMPWIWPLGLALCWLSLAVARWLWQQPTRKRLNQASWVVGIAIGAGGVLATKIGWQDETRDRLPLVLALMAAVLSAWWMVTLFRVQQIEARLRELAEQDAALKLSTRLAAAQIQPHFLFNTLASLQHWVDTGDARAAPLLRDFTAYLRATLPMFERELQPLADELEMVRRYLAIMQARLGARLSFGIDLPAGVDALLPPGIVLTLVENAIAHGIEPQLRGGHVAVAVRRDGANTIVTVRDDGPGLAADQKDGVGLTNTRRRLAQACPSCTLTLTSADPGCLATLTLTP